MKTSRLRRKSRDGLGALLAVVVGAAEVRAQAADPDLNNDGIVNILDVSLVGSCFGQTPPVLPEVQITDPLDGSIVDASPVDVSGTVDIAPASVDVDGVAATLSGQGFVATGIPLQEGVNTITATATTPPDRCVVADTDADGDVDMEDIIFVNSSFGQSGFPVGPPDPDVRVGTTIIQVMLETAQPTLNVGVVSARVYDDTNSLPVMDATLELVSLDGEPPASATVVKSDALGRFRLVSDPGVVRIRISKESFTSADRTVLIVEGKRSDPRDARLTTRDTGVLVTSVLGGDISDASQQVRLAIPHGALSEDLTLQLTPVGAQGLVGVLPLGWSVVAALDIFPEDVLFSSPVSASLAAPERLPAGATLPVARWDDATGQWIAVGEATRSQDGEHLELALKSTGQYAVLLADNLDAPPAPTLGQAVPGLFPRPPPNSLTAEITPSPRILFARPEARALVGVRMIPSEPVPSGTVFVTDLEETFDFFDDKHLYPEPVQQDFMLSAFPPAGGSALGLASGFAVGPSRTFANGRLLLGIIDLSVRVPGNPGAPRGTVVDSSGGSAEASRGERVTLPSGATTEPLPVLFEPLPEGEFPIEVPQGFSFASAVRFDLHGGRLEQPATFSVPAPGNVSSGDTVVLVQIVEFLGVSRLALVAVAEVQGSELVTVTDVRGDGTVMLPGPRAGGRYAFLAASEPLGFVTGVVKGTDTLPLAGALVSVDTLALVALSDEGGRYVLASPLGPVQLTAVDPRTEDGVTVTGTLDSADAALELDSAIGATPPSVAFISPAAGALDVPLTSAVRLGFSEPIDPASLIAGTVVVSAAGAAVPGTLSLTPDNTLITFRPDAFLASQTTYQVAVAGTVQDLSGNPMGVPFVSQFTTVDVTPPLPPPAGSLAATIPDASGNTTVSGSQGTAEPDGLVIVKNLTTGVLTTVTPNADGSFSAIVPASTADKLEIVLRDAAGNEIVAPLGRFRSTDGSVVVGSEGGRVEGPGGVFVDIPTGALPDGTVVKVDPVAETGLDLAVPSGFGFAGAIRLDLGGVTPSEPLDVGTLAPPDASDRDQVLVTRVVQMPRRQAWTIADRAHLENGSYVTASFPFVGVVDQGTLSFIRYEGKRIKPGVNEVLDSLPPQDDDVIEQIQIVVTGIVTGQNGVLDSTPAGDDVIVTNNSGAAVIAPGPNEVLDSTAAGDDVVRHDVIVPGFVDVVRGGPNVRLDTTVQGDDILERDCLSYVTLNWQFSIGVGFLASGMPFVYPQTTAGTATMPAVCDSPVTVRAIEPNTEQVILEITQRAPAVPDEIFFFPAIVTDDDTPPVILWSNVPAPGAVEDVAVLFSKAMDPESVGQNFRVEDSTGHDVPGTVLLDAAGTLARFIPSFPFRYGETYAVSLVGARDGAGNFLEQDQPIVFSTFAPTSFGLLADVPALTNLLQKCNGATCSTSVRDVAFLGNTLFVANGQNSADEQYHDPADPARLVAVDMTDPSNPRLIGSHPTATNPKALTVVQNASFSIPDGDPFTGDLLLVVGGGRVQGGELAGKLEVYDVTACTRGLTEENCLDASLDPFKGFKLLSTPSGLPPRPGVPFEWGIPLQIAALHESSDTEPDDVLLAYVVDVPIGLQAVDITKAFNVPATPSSNFAPDGLVRGEFLDVAVLKNLVLSIELDTTSGQFFLDVFPAQLRRDRFVALPGSAVRLAAVENLVIDVDGDGNLGLGEENDGDATTAKDELFDLVALGSGAVSDFEECKSLFGQDPAIPDAPVPVPCGALYLADISPLTDLAHDGPPEITTRIPLPGPAFSVQVDRERLLAYVEVRGRGLAVVDISRLSGLEMVDTNEDLLDDRILHIFPKSGIFAGEIKVDTERGVAYVNDSVTGLEQICIDDVKCRDIPLAEDVFLHLALRSGSLDTLTFLSPDGETSLIPVTPEAWAASSEVCATLDAVIPSSQNVTYAISEVPLGGVSMLELGAGGATGPLDATAPTICAPTRSAQPFPLHSFVVVDLFENPNLPPVKRLLLHLAPAAVEARDIRLVTALDRINLVNGQPQVCSTGEDLRFQLTRGAIVNVAVDGSLIEQGVSRAAGTHAIPITPDMVSLPGPHAFQITAVFETPGPAVTSMTTGFITHDVELNAAVPVGHSMVNGIDLWDGHLAHSTRDVVIPGRGLSLDFTRTYSSAGTTSRGPLGAGWTHTYNVRLVKDSCGRFVVIGGEGTGNAFVFDGTEFRPQVGYHSSLEKDPSDSSQYDFFTKGHVRYHFQREPALSGETYTLRFIEEPNGNRVTLDYLSGDSDARTLDSITDASGRSLLLDHELIAGNPRIVKLTGQNAVSGGDLLGLEILYRYDSHGNLESVTRRSPDPAANLNDERVESYAYSVDQVTDRHNLVNVTDPNGNTSTYEYHEAGETIPGADTFGVSPQEIVKTVREPEDVLTRFAYDFGARTRTVTDPRSEDPSDPRPPPPTTYTLNDYGATVRIDAPLGRSTVMEWCTDAPDAACPDRQGNPGLDVLVVKKIDAEGRTHLYEYSDGLGNLTRETVQFTGNKAPVTLADGITPIGQIETTHSYEPTFAKETSATDAEGRTTLYLIDAPYPGKPDFCPDPSPDRDTGNLLGMKDAEENVTCYSYADNGNRLSVTDPRNFVTQYTQYDLYGNPSEIIDPEGNVTSNVFDERSRLVETRDTFTHHRRLAYDGLDRRIREERLDDLGDLGSAQIVTYSYKPNGELLETTDGLGQKTVYAYDGLNRRVEQREEEILQADGSTQALVMSLAYDRGSNVVSATDPRGIGRLHLYDELNRLVESRVEGSFTPDEVVHSAEYDLVDNKLSETDLHGHATGFVYDGLYRVVRIALPHDHPFTDVPSVNTAIQTRAYDRMGNEVIKTDANGEAGTYEYDRIYRLVRETDADGNVKTYAYDSASNKIRAEDLSSGMVTEYSGHDGLNRAQTVRQTVPFGATGLTTAVYETSYEYDDENNAVVVTNARGFETRTDLDGLDRTFQQIVDVGGLDLTTTYTYDGNGNVATIRDPEGGDIDVSHEYDGLNRLLRSSYVSTTSDPGPVTEEFVYDGNNNLIRYEDKRDIVFLNTYDNLDRILEKKIVETVTNGGAVLTLAAYVYEDSETKVTETDANGNATVTYSDGLHRARIVDDPDPNGPFDPTGPGPFPIGIQSLEYDGENKRAEVDKKGQRTEFDYDTVNRLIDVRELDAAGTLRTTAHVDYLDEQLQQKETDRRGIVTTLQSDGLQRVVQRRRSGLDLADHYGVEEVVLETHEYDGNSNHVAFVDGGGNRTDYVYDGADRTVAMTEGAGSPVAATSTYTYDHVNNLLTAKDGRQHGAAFDWRLAYDERYRRVRATNGEGETTTYRYDGNDNVIQMTEPESEAFTTRYAYDELDQLVAVDETPRASATTAAGESRFFFDGNRNRIAQQDSNGNLTTFKYDGLNRLTGVLQHTAPGQLTGATVRGSDPRGGEFYQLHAGGDEATALSWQYGYDLNSNRNAIVDALGQRVDLAYDYLDRLENKTYGNHAEPDLDFQMSSVQYGYDNNSNIETITEVKRFSGGDVTETTALTYDPLERVQTRIHRDHDDAAGKSIAYDYDVQGNRRTVTDPDDVRTTYTYDARNRLTTAETEAGSTSYSWWEDSLLKSVQYPNGTVIDRGNPTAYDAAERLVLTVNRASDGQVLSQYEYLYDENGNRLSQVETQTALNGGSPATTTYAYDDLNRLLSVDYGSPGRIDYTYAPNGNRLTERGVDPRTGLALDRTYRYEELPGGSEATFDHVNALTQIVDNVNPAANVTFEYDRNLNQIAREEGGARQEFRFGIRDQILSAHGSSGAPVVFDYDHDRMRVKKIDTATNMETRYLYDQRSVLTEYTGAGGAFQTFHKYEYGYELLSLTRVDITTGARNSRFYLTDALMSTANLTDEAGQLVQTYRYDAWGRVLDESGNVENPRQYTGHYTDEETGLHYFGARYYDDETGRFLSQDPSLGNPFDVPSLHRYLFAHANPLRFVDLAGYAATEANAGHAAGGNGGTAAVPVSGPAFQVVREDYVPEERATAGWALTVGSWEPVFRHRDYLRRRQVQMALESPYEMDPLEPTGAWAGDLARSARRKALAREEELGEWVGEDPSLLKTVWATAAQTGWDVTALFADTLRVGEGAAEGGWGYVEDAFRVFDLVTTLYGAPKVGGRIAGKGRDILRRGIKSQGKKLFPSGGATQYEEMVLREVLGEELAIGIRALDPLTSAGTRRAARKGILPKPMRVTEKTSLGGTVKAEGQTFRSDLDIAWIRNRKTGEFLSREQAWEVISALNRKSKVSFRYQHGAHFNAWRGGELTWAEYGLKAGNPGPVVEYSLRGGSGALQTRTFAESQVRLFSRIHPDSLPWHPAWDVARPVWVDLGKDFVQLGIVLSPRSPYFAKGAAEK